MTHAKSHGGFAAQAKRRNEQYLMCLAPHCGQRAHPRIPRQQASYVDTFDIGCVQCGATYTAGETHQCATPVEQGERAALDILDLSRMRRQAEPEEQWGPVKFLTVVVFGIAFLYAVVIIAAAGQVAS